MGLSKRKNDGKIKHFGYDEETVIRLLSWSLSENRIINDFDLNQTQWEDVFSFFYSHAVVSIALEIAKIVPDEYAEIKTHWRESIYFNVSSYTRLARYQDEILKAFERNQIPVVVLKGTSAAKYYPTPQLRTMGDIDLLVIPKNFHRAVDCMIYAGCREVTRESEKEIGRHRSFRYKDSDIELHNYFSFNVDEEKAMALDNLLYNAISDKDTVLPDDENGLVLLSHIRQHLEEGLGLRQIIDWFMFVRACLDDEMWYSSFQEKAKITGLAPLAITVTRMCQIHLGLTTENIMWCNDADEAVCNDLMQYVMDCGNFGRSREMLQSQAVEKLPSIAHPIQLLKYIQAHGETNWKALKKHPYLKPFAWIYQSCRYIKLAIQNKVTPNKLKAIYDEGNKRNEMFAALGLK